MVFLLVNSAEVYNCYWVFLVNVLLYHWPYISLQSFSICSERSRFEYLLWVEVMERALRWWMMLGFSLRLSSHTIQKERKRGVYGIGYEDNLVYDEKYCNESFDIFSGLVIRGLIIASPSGLCLKLQGIYNIFHNWTYDTGKHAVDSEQIHVGETNVSSNSLWV